MKKLFNDRARLVVYMDHSDLIRMTSKAKEQGETLVEWARGVLQEEIAAEPMPDGPTKKLGKAPVTNIAVPDLDVCDCDHPKKRHRGAGCLDCGCIRSF